MWYGIGIVLGGLALWYLIGQAWASSVAQHNPELREGAGQERYGWRCTRCGAIQAPVCPVKKCGGPLVWVQHNTRIKCARCHFVLIPHPMLFRSLPKPRKVHCRQCGWRGKISDFRID